MPEEIVGRLNWHGERLVLRPAQLSDVPRIVRLSRQMMGEMPHRPDPDDRDAWFALGGSWMHAHYCERHLKVYADLGGDIWLVVNDEDELIGNVELWYDDEPEPFGRYGHIELLDLLPEYLDDKIEEWLIDAAEARARERGFQRFWCRPVGSGGSPHLLSKRGYEPLWASAQVTLRNLGLFQPAAHHATQLQGDYAIEAAHLLSLNHREASGFRWRYIWRPLLNPRAADWPASTAFWGRQVSFPPAGGGICLVSVWNWSQDPSEARVDLWVRPDLVTSASNTSALLAVAAGKALELGARSLISYLPKQLALELDSAEIEASPLEYDDPWYLKAL